MPASPIKVLTLNMWGIPLTSKKIRERTNHLVAHLLDSDYTVVGLQEVFASWHAKMIQDKVQVN